MRASSRPVQALASLFAAAALGTFAPACSLGVEPTPLDDESPLLPPLLEFESPRPDLVYSAADDQRPDVPGVQLLLRVRVNDLENGVWLEDIALGALSSAGGNDDELTTAPIHEDWRGLRCAEIPIVLFPGDEPRRLTLVASAGAGLGQVQQDLVIGAARSATVE